jgi:hypothetical protein
MNVVEGVVISCVSVFVGGNTNTISYIRRTYGIVNRFQMTDGSGHPFLGM